MKIGLKERQPTHRDIDCGIHRRMRIRGPFIVEYRQVV
jgi:hypothetical protein